jgi:hypothetical protein
MNSWAIAKKRYINIHEQKDLKQPSRRLNALAAIEKMIDEKYPKLLSDPNIFKNITQDDFTAKYYKAKGKSLSSAEKSVIHGLYNLSV